MPTLHRTIVRPIVTEKSSEAYQERGEYHFEVHPDATKPAIRQAIESLFGVKVVKVTTANRKGKRKRNRRQFTFGKRADTKRAIVTLAPGGRIDLFES